MDNLLYMEPRLEVFTRRDEGMKGSVESSLPEHRYGDGSHGVPQVTVSKEQDMVTRQSTYQVQPLTRHGTSIEDS